jgi:hypothetical protein
MDGIGEGSIGRLRRTVYQLPQFLLDPSIAFVGAGTATDAEVGMLTLPLDV